MKKNLFLFCCITASFIFYFISCRKQDTINQPKANFTVEEAQNWFDKNALSQKQINNFGDFRNTHHTDNWISYWQGAKSYKIGTEWIMEIPFQSGEFSNEGTSSFNYNQPEKYSRFARIYHY